MTEQEKLQRAKYYMDCLANGMNPLDGTSIPEQDVVNQVKISRCLFYVADVLRRQIELQEKKGERHAGKQKLPFHITKEEQLQYEPSQTPIPASAIGRQINEILGGKGMRKVTYRAISEWLVSVGLLEEEKIDSGKSRKVPTASGIAMGITTELRTGMRGVYPCIVYDENAQDFVVENLNEIMDPEREERPLL